LNPKSGIRIKLAPGAARIPCLLFANDSLLFCNDTSQAAFNLKAILDTFYQQSGQLIDLHKALIVYPRTLLLLTSNMLRES